MKILSFVFSLFWEKKCYACGQVWHFFCLSCLQKLHHYAPYCYVCKKRSDHFFVHKDCQSYFPLMQVIVLTRYRQAPISRALKHAKYYGKYRLYEDLLCPEWIISHKHISSLSSGILIPVPMHFFRKWKRGYNQAQKIAEQFATVLHFPLDTKLVQRSRYTKHQSHLSQSERLKNLKGSFQVLPHSHSYSLDTPLYLIDDVISTGSTLCEIAITLQKAGFRDIRAIVIASD